MDVGNGSEGFGVGREGHRKQRVWYSSGRPEAMRQGVMQTHLKRRGRAKWGEKLALRWRPRKDLEVWGQIT